MAAVLWARRTSRTFASADTTPAFTTLGAKHSRRLCRRRSAQCKMRPPITCAVATRPMDTMPCTMLVLEHRQSHLLDWAYRPTFHRNRALSTLACGMRLTALRASRTMVQLRSPLQNSHLRLCLASMAMRYQHSNNDQWALHSAFPHYRLREPDWTNMGEAQPKSRPRA